MPDYPAIEYPVPKIFDADDVRTWEEALRQLAVANELIKKCERCNIPVSEARKDCDGLCNHFNALLAEERGQQGSVEALR